MDTYTAEAERYVNIIRSQNWKNGGVLTIDHSDAVDLIAQALRTAHSAGALEAAAESGKNIMRALDEATLIGGPQTEAVERFSKMGA